MAILEITLEKPALVEEYQHPNAGGTRSSTSTRSSTGIPSSDRMQSLTGSDSGSDSKSSGGGKGKLVGLLAVVAGVGLLAWKLKSRGGSEQTDFDEYENEEYVEGEEQSYEHGPEPEIGGDESGGAKRKVASALGLVVALASLVAVVRKRRN